MPYIANIFFNRPDAPDGKNYKKIGKIWHDPSKERSAILMTGIKPEMVFAAKPFDDIEKAPYISGDLCVCVGSYTKADGTPKKEYQWCGHIQSQDDENGNVMYTGVIEVVPLVPIDQGRTGIFMSVFDEQGPRPRAQPAEEATDDTGSEDNLPF